MSAEKAEVRRAAEFDARETYWKLVHAAKISSELPDLTPLECLRVARCMYAGQNDPPYYRWTERQIAEAKNGRAPRWSDPGGLMPEYPGVFIGKGRF